jgi:predicted membrane chloride channel (bestrophin family)
MLLSLTVKEKLYINCFMLPLAALQQMAIYSYMPYTMVAYLYFAPLVCLYYAAVVCAQSSPKY